MSTPVEWLRRFARGEQDFADEVGAHRVSRRLIAMCAAALGSAGGQPSAAPGPVPAIAGILSAFSRAPIVAIPDPHRDSAFSDFRIALIRDPAFAAPGRVIVIEWGNAQYQDIIDRFIAGEDSVQAISKLVWRTAIGGLGGIWDSPVYEQFLYAVRDVNRRLPAARRLRVITCFPPMDWGRIHTDQDYLTVAPLVEYRDSFCAGVLEREVLAKGRSALLIMGGGHLLRGSAYADLPEPNVTHQLDARHPGSIFVVTNRGSRDSDELTRGWREPAFLLLRGTVLGRDATEAGPLETLADGFLFLRRSHDVGPDSTFYADSTLRREMIRRLCIAQGPSFPVDPIPRCGSAPILQQSPLPNGGLIK